MLKTIKENKMISINDLKIGGKLYKIKEIQTKSGKPMASFTVRVFEKFGDKETTTFFNCVCFSKTAEILLKYGEEKRECFVEGKVQLSKDDEGKDRFSVLANSVQLLGEKVA
jgi:single-stranded DNA-binding protein